MVRKATLDDVHIIVPLFNDYRKFYNQPVDTEAAEQFLRERLQQGESIIFISFIEETPVGFTQLYPIFSSVSLSRTWLLNDLFVAEKARRTGMATALLKQAEAFAIESNARWLLLETAHDNYPAQKLYEQLGWVKENNCFYKLQIK